MINKCLLWSHTFVLIYVNIRYRLLWRLDIGTFKLIQHIFSSEEVKIHSRGTRVCAYALHRQDIKGDMPRRKEACQPAMGRTQTATLLPSTRANWPTRHTGPGEAVPQGENKMTHNQSWDFHQPESHEHTQSQGPGAGIFREKRDTPREAIYSREHLPGSKEEEKEPH